MKNKLKFLALVVTVLFFTTATCNTLAEGIGYINYKKVLDNYNYAKTAMKEIDAQALSLQQYLIDKEKEFKTLDTPVKKKAFEDKTAKEFKAKEDAYKNLRYKKEQEIFNKVQTAAKTVMIEQKLDAIVTYEIIFVGGIDVTDLVISKLK